MAADAASKTWARQVLVDGPMALGVLDLELGFNSGVAFGLGAEQPGWLVLIVSGLALLMLLIAASRLGSPNAIALVVGGGAANLLDRVGDGTVTDFLQAGWWPTFNVADIAVTIGAGWLAIAALRSGEPAAESAQPGHLRG